ncbi:MAG: uracil-DNA glycosylase [Rickettsiales bacterium]|nr:uracil-DNA glycosylase [Rickettsiales bacterium]
MSLQDLVLGGVRWELFPGSVLPIQEKNGESKTKIKVNDKKVEPDDKPPLSVVPPIPVAPRNELACAANAAAQAAGDVDTLCAAVKEFNHPLSGFANAVMPQIRKRGEGKGNLIIITDVPSADDDANGSIMTGAAGELLDKMLGSIGLPRTSVSIVPLVFWRTPGNRTPSREELDLARPFVMQAINIACKGNMEEEKGNDIILTLGALAALEIGGAKLPADHGKEIILPASTFLLPCIPIWHPNYLILKPDAKRDVWDALQKVREFMA